MTTHNPNCDGNKCISETGEVRRLPMHSFETGSALILCHACYTHEIRYRKIRNKGLDAEAKFDLPSWDSLEVYGG